MACTIPSRRACAFLYSCAAMSSVCVSVSSASPAHCRQNQRQSSSASVLLSSYPTSTAPPFTFNTSPLMNPASGVTEQDWPGNFARGATRPTGIVSDLDRLALHRRARSRHIRCDPAGATQFTRMPARRQFTGQTLCETDEGAFGYGVVGMVGSPRWPAVELINTICPQILPSLAVWRSIWATEPEQDQDGVEIDAEVSCHCASVMCAIGASSDGQTPWFATRTSRRLNAFTLAQRAAPSSASSDPAAGQRSTRPAAFGGEGCGLLRLPAGS